jgi:hypothetical protein
MTTNRKRLVLRNMRRRKMTTRRMKRNTHLRTTLKRIRRRVTTRVRTRPRISLERTNTTATRPKAMRRTRLRATRRIGPRATRRTRPRITKRKTRLSTRVAKITLMKLIQERIMRPVKITITTQELVAQRNVITKILT